MQTSSTSAPNQVGIGPFREIVDLGHDLFNGMPNLGANIVAFWPLETFEATRTLSSGRLGMEGRMMLIAEHCGTHLDVPSHFVEGGTSVDQVPLEQLILPGHLLDFTHKGIREPITPADFEAAEQRSGRRIGPETAVLAWTGADKNWSQPGFQTERPYVPVDSAEWLVERKITLFGTDLIGMDDPDEWWWPTHLVWLKAGIPMIQMLTNLDRIADRFTLVALPLRLKGMEIGRAHV